MWWPPCCEDGAQCQSFDSPSALKPLSNMTNTANLTITQREKKKKDLDSPATDPERYYGALSISACFLSETAPTGLNRVSLMSKTRGEINESGIRLFLTNQGSKAGFYAVHIDCNGPVEPIRMTWGQGDFRDEGKLYLWRNANEQRGKACQVPNINLPLCKGKKLGINQEADLKSIWHENKNGSLQIQWCVTV